MRRLQMSTGRQYRYNMQCIVHSAAGNGMAATQLLTPSLLSPQSAVAAAVAVRRRDRVWRSPATDK